jgi:hypothetical protein
MVTIRKITIVLFCFIFLMELCALIGLEIYYSSDLPQIPNEQAGRFYQMTVNHGFVVYGTKQEFQILKVTRKCIPLGGICGLIAGILNFKYRDFSSRRSKPEF